MVMNEPMKIFRQHCVLAAMTVAWIAAPIAIPFVGIDASRNLNPIGLFLAGVFVSMFGWVFFFRSKRLCAMGATSIRKYPVFRIFGTPEDEMLPLNRLFYRLIGLFMLLFSAALWLMAIYRGFLA